MGWLIGEASEMVTGQLMTRRTASVIRKLQQERAQLAGEWDSDLLTPDKATLK